MILGKACLSLNSFGARQSTRFVLLWRSGSRVLCCQSLPAAGAGRERSIRKNYTVSTMSKGSPENGGGINASTFCPKGGIPAVP